MYIRIEDRAGLAEAAGWVVKNLRLRSTEPVYGGALLTAEAEGLVIEGFDTTTATRFRVPAETGGQAQVLVSARLLAEVARLLPNHPVELEAAGGELVISCGASRASLPLMPVEDYPARPAAPSAVWRCPAADLAASVIRVAAAASTDAGDLELSCVVLDLPERVGEPVRMYGTNRAALSAARIPAEPTHGAIDGVLGGRVLVPAAAVEAAARALATDPGGQIGLGSDGRVLAMDTAARRVTLATVDHPGRDYEKILGSAEGCEFAMPRQEFEAALKRLSLHRDAPKARIECGENVVRLAVRGQQGISEETLAVDYTGQPVTVGMMTRHLVTALHHLGTDLAHFTVPAQPTRPWLLRPVTDNGTPAEDYRHMVIPAKLHDGEAAA
ncbi:hypothetical protein AB0L88_01360 [Saccharopolyspora shandongensis]|uniref:hypothetical protein n=1 Tax=Saccharopolyspora shandongensis TaxID=418495 RepID=UPI00343B1042